MRHNTEEDSKVASWWDYGYQATAMANRTVIVDNNTWNNTHIATVGRAMSSPEKKASKYQHFTIEFMLYLGLEDLSIFGCEVCVCCVWRVDWVPF